MKKIIIIKDNILGFILGAILFGGIGTVLATTILSSTVSYTNNNQTTVEAALDELYSMVNNVCYNGTCGKLAYRYWNDNFSESNYTRTQVPTINYTSRELLEQNYSNFSQEPIYIRSTLIDGNVVGHEACIYYNNREFCVSPNYWIHWAKKIVDQSTFNDTATILKTIMNISLNLTSSDVMCTGAIPNELLCTFGNNYAYSEVFDENVHPFGIYLDNNYVDSESLNTQTYCYIEASSGMATCNRD